MTKEEARARVARGAALLDTRIPGWAALLNLGALDLRSGSQCVLGQLDGDSETRGHDRALARKLFRIRRWQLWRLDTLMEAHGFDANDHISARVVESDRMTLRDVWIEAIADRLVPTVDEGTADPARFTLSDESKAIGSATDRLSEIAR